MQEKYYYVFGLFPLFLKCFLFKWLIFTSGPTMGSQKRWRVYWNLYQALIMPHSEWCSMIWDRGYSTMLLRVSIDEINMKFFVIFVCFTFQLTTVLQKIVFYSDLPNVVEIVVFVIKLVSNSLSVLRLLKDT